MTGAPVLVVGRGLIGSAVRDRLISLGVPVVTVARTAANGEDGRARDVSGPTGQAGLRADLAALRPRCVVLAHGPSDVSWIEAHETQAAAAHCGVAELMARAEVPTLLVSTDNVFSGERGGNRPDDRVRPGNAYGRIKARAERILLTGACASVLRVSLVFGWAGPAYRSTFAERCLHAALAGERFAAPTDQLFTPVHVADVAMVIGQLCREVPPRRGVAHLAGAEQLSRYEFARLAYRVAGADVGLVRPCLRRDTEWASRPRYSSLACSDFTDVPGLGDWRPAGMAAALTTMLGERPAAGRSRR